MKKRILSFILIFYLAIGQILVANELPKVKAKGAILIDGESGRVLYEKNAYEQLPMASTTKIMTCIVALESGKVDDIVTASKRASHTPPVKIHLKIGEKQRLGDLLYALMMQSSNDAAVAIAEHIGGSVEEFCDLMTAKAREIGAMQTSFKTPNGLDAEGHYSTAYDMALIGAYAIKNPDFVKIVTTELISIPTIELKGSERHDLQNKNRFIYAYEGANGLKTGFTNKAGHCFVGGACKKDMQLIGVALGSGWGKAGRTQKYTDVTQMMNYGFKHYHKVKLVEPKEINITLPIEHALQKEVTIGCDESIILPLTELEEKGIVIQEVLPSKLEAPVYAGKKVGELQVTYEGEVLATKPLIVTETVKKAKALDYIKEWLNKNK